MASASTIRAGKAAVELMCDDTKLARGLKRAAAKIKAWGAGISALGSGVMVAGLADIAKGLALIGGLGGAAKTFAATGDALDKMSARTGFTVEQLSALEFATSQSGAKMEELERAIRDMQKKGLGSGLADLERFADELASIEDPGKKAARAMQIFGESGTRLLPLLNGGAAGMRALAKEGESLGLVLSTEDAKSAAALTDAFDKMARQMKAAWVMAGSAVAPAFKMLFEDLQPLLRSTVAWAKENKDLVAMLLKLGAASVAVGALELAFGGLLKVGGLAITGLGIGINALTAAVPLLGAAIAGLASPIGLFTLGLGAATAAWLAWTEEGQGAVRGMRTAWGSLATSMKTAWSGVVDFIAIGDLAGAMKTAWAGAKVVWLQAITSLKTIWLSMTTSMAKALVTFWAGLQAGWAIIIANLKTKLIGFVKDVEEGALADFLISLGLVDKPTEKQKKAREKERARELAGVEAEKQAAGKAAFAEQAELFKALDQMKAEDLKALAAQVKAAEQELADLAAAAKEAREDPFRGAQGIGDALAEAAGNAGLDVGEEGQGPKRFQAGTFDPNALRGLGGGAFDKIAESNRFLAKIAKDQANVVELLRRGGLVIT